MNRKALVETSTFKTDFKKIAKSGKYKKEDIKEVLLHLINNETLPTNYKDHALIGEWDGHRECHIKPDWLLIYKLTDDKVTLIRTGSHSKLFG